MAIHDGPVARRVFTVCAVAFFAVALAGVSGQAATAATTTKTARVGAKCPKLNATSGTFVCAKKAGKLVWSRIAVTTTTGGAKTVPSTTKAVTSGSGAASTTVASGGSGSDGTPVGSAGIEGTWRATSKSEVGYRVKEVLIGQSAEAVGRTNAVTGTLTISGTKVTAVDLVVDVTRLKSDSDRRDGQVQNRILDTSKFPTATLKLAAPVDFGSEPADREQIKAKTTASLTVRGVTRNISFEVIARRNGAAIEVNGAIPFAMADFGIPDPSIVDLVKTEQNGLLEFLVVFER